MARFEITNVDSYILTDTLQEVAIKYILGSSDENICKIYENHHA